jgi:hypothetical protein
MEARMRTTLTLDDDVYELVRHYAEGRSQPMGKAVSELVRRGLAAPLRTKLVNGFHVVDLPADSPPVTTEHVKRINAESE